MFQNCQLPAPTLPPKRIILVPGKTVPIITIKPSTSNSLQPVSINSNQYVVVSPEPTTSLLSPSSFQSSSPYSDCGYSSSTLSTNYQDANDVCNKIPEDINEIDESVIQTVLAGKAPSQVNQPKRKQRRERLTNMSSEEKANRRKWRNRVAAQTARDRKKERTNILELALKKLIKENEELRKENARLSERNRELCNLLPSDVLSSQHSTPQTYLESAVFDRLQQRDPICIGRSVRKTGMSQLDKVKMIAVKIMVILMFFKKITTETTMLMTTKNSKILSMKCSETSNQVMILKKLLERFPKMITTLKIGKEQNLHLRKKKMCLLMMRFLVKWKKVMLQMDSGKWMDNVITLTLIKSINICLKGMKTLPDMKIVDTTTKKKIKIF